MSVDSRVKSVLFERLGVSPDRIKLQSDLKADLGADSFDMIGLALDIEDEFGIELEDDALENCKTVGDLVNLVERLT